MLMYCRRVSSFLLTFSLLGFLAACVSSPDPQDGIRIGVTTKDEIIARYGQPDVLMSDPGGDTAIYRAPDSDASAPTPMQPIAQGLGATYLGNGAKERVSNEVHIRYDARGVVQELSSP